MKTIHLYGSTIALICLTVFFANINMLKAKLSHVGALQAPRKTEATYVPALLKKPKLAVRVLAEQSATAVSQPAAPPAAPPARPAVTTAAWHYDCRPQPAAVKQAVADAGLSAEWPAISAILEPESCLDPGRLNYLNCAGLGQACPGTKLTCGPDDITCQIGFFNRYAIERYGSWWTALSFRQAHNWW
jgi:hypothetical protein